MKSVAVFLAFHFCISLSFSTASEPQSERQLYNKIKEQTGVSLKEAFQAVDGSNVNSTINLQIFSRKEGPNEIENALDEEYNQQNKLCSLRPSATCQQSLKELKEHQNLVQDLRVRFDHLQDPEKIFYGLLVYYYSIRGPMFANELQSCAHRDNCQILTPQVQNLIAIARDLSLVAIQLKDEKTKNQELLKSLKKRIAAYEKF